MLFQAEFQETGWTGPGMMEPTFPSMPSSPMPQPASSPRRDEPMRAPAKPKRKAKKAAKPKAKKKKAAKKKAGGKKKARPKAKAKKKTAKKRRR